MNCCVLTSHTVIFNREITRPISNNKIMTYKMILTKKKNNFFVMDSHLRNVCEKFTTENNSKEENRWIRNKRYKSMTRHVMIFNLRNNTCSNLIHRTPKRRIRCHAARQNSHLGWILRNTSVNR
jgi:hypothetical protein